MDLEQQVTTMLAGSDSNLVFQQMVPTFANDLRFSISTVSTSWFDFEKTLDQARPELLVVHANIAPSTDSLIKSLSRLHIWNGVAIIILNLEDAKVKPTLEKIGTCRSVYMLPVNWGEVTQVGHSAVMTERTKGASQDMIVSAKAQQTASTLTGMSTVAFISASGGAGRTTIAENIGYELGRTGAKTLLLPLDLPTPTPMHLRLHTTPNASEFFSRPRDGFNPSIQKYADLLDIILAPDNSVSYAKSAMNEGENSIYALVHQTWNKNYGAVLLDLPNGEGPWMTQPLLAANKVVIVARPTLADLRGIFHIMTLLTEKMNREVQVPKTNIFLVINQFSEKATFSPKQMIDELLAKAGWNPMLAGTISFNANIPLIQDNQELPINKDDDFAKSIRSIISKVFRISVSDTQKSKGGILGGLFGGK
jgi:cellulose biosynthesis protein BcsQ